MDLAAIPPPAFPGRPVKPGETMEFHTRMVWLPLPEFASHDNAAEFRRLLEQNERHFTLRFSVNYHFAYVTTIHPRFDASGQPLKEGETVREGLTASELATKRPEYPLNANFGETKQVDYNVTILPRSPESTDLLQAWYLELPTTASADRWTMEHIFAHPYHVKGSPYKMEAPTPFELGQKRAPFNEAYRKFFASMETRTPEVEARIKQTNELADKLLALPDSEVSPHMKEFITLRGLLVDLRYAEENEAARDKAFEKIVDWVKASKNKILWVLVLKEIGLPSIRNHKHFPQQIVDGYVSKLVAAFPEEAKASLADLDREQAETNAEKP